MEETRTTALLHDDAGQGGSSAHSQRRGVTYENLPSITAWDTARGRSRDGAAANTELVACSLQDA